MRFQHLHKQVTNNSISEVCGKNLTLNQFFDYESN